MQHLTDAFCRDRHHWRSQAQASTAAEEAIATRTNRTFMIARASYLGRSLFGENNGTMRVRTLERWLSTDTRNRASPFDGNVKINTIALSATASVATSWLLYISTTTRNMTINASSWNEQQSIRALNLETSLRHHNIIMLEHTHHRITFPSQYLTHFTFGFFAAFLALGHLALTVSALPWTGRELGLGS